MPAFTTVRRVQFAETDMAGIVHFANYYRWMEETEHEWFRSMGFSIMEDVTEGVIGWPRVSAKCRFEAPALFEDEIQIQLFVRRKGVKSLELEFEFFKSGRRIANGHMKTVCCIVRHGEPLESIEIPAAIAERIEVRN